MNVKFLDYSNETNVNNDDCEICGISGLSFRMKRPFEFLGLYKTHPDSCRRPNIPAKRISGNANEEQILIAMQANLDRTEVLANVLNNLYGDFQQFKNKVV